MKIKWKRIVTDPETGERTQVTTTNASGQVIWRVTQEQIDDENRARERGRKYSFNLAWLRRIIG